MGDINLKNHLLLVFFIMLNQAVAAQVFMGMVLDSTTQEPLISATIKHSNGGSVTDEKGAFSITNSNNEVEVSYLGYITRKVRLNPSPTVNVIRLITTSNVIDPLIITGSKYQRRLSESTVSVEVIKPQLIKSVNTSKGNEILNKIPGVQVVGGQANIRGGSGFSYGAGSRVMVLLDGMPALQADAGFANWGDLPVENIDQVEVLKGAASSLYGSAALNGIVNFRRKKATSTPQTEIFTAYTQFLDPAIDISKWWDDVRYRVNVGASHTQKVGKLDVNGHGFYSDFQSYNKDTYETRLRGGLNLSYHFKPRLTIGINTIYNYNSAQDFFLWDNDLRGLYKPFSGTLSSGTRHRYMIDPFVKYKDISGNQHLLQLRHLGIRNENAFNRSNFTSSNFGEYQYQRSLDACGLIITAGTALTNASTRAELYGDTSFIFTNIGVYTQLEYTNGPWTVSAGSRYEYNQVLTPSQVGTVSIPDSRISDDEIVNRLGLSYKTSFGSNIRASWGQGYRFPTISERFIETNFGGFNVFPTPLLQSENGWTAELAYRQSIARSIFKGYIDVAFFTSRYFDMIEFSFLSNPLGFKPINVGDTQIDGLELSTRGAFNLGQITLTYLGGYTYINPFYRNWNDRPEIRDNVSTNQNILKYRSRHSAKIDLEAQYKGIKAGFSMQHYSHQVNIDRRLETPLEGIDLIKIKAFRDRYKNGYQIIDVRLGYQLKKLNFNFIVGNIINEVYAIRPGLLEAPRNITLRVDYGF